MHSISTKKTINLETQEYAQNKLNLKINERINA